jgi:hypothetical protein
MIYEYVKDKHGHLKGVVCATSNIGIGWSLCRKEDKFDKDFGIRIAEGRAKKIEKISEEIEDSFINIEVPPSITDQFDKMVERAEKYYKLN